MDRRTVLKLGLGMTAALAGGGSRALAQQAPAPAPPPFATRKLSDTVYLFRYGGHQSIFVVTPDGVIATDPIGYLRPLAVRTYIDEIRKVTQAPIKYVVYSHHHYDHIAGGKPFKELARPSSPTRTPRRGSRR